MAPGVGEADAETSGVLAVQGYLERVIVIVAETCLDVDFAILVAEFSRDDCTSIAGVGAHRGNAIGDRALETVAPLAAHLGEGQYSTARKGLLYRKGVGQHVFRQLVSDGVRARRKADGISRIKVLEDLSPVQRIGETGGGHTLQLHGYDIVEYLLGLIFTLTHAIVVSGADSQHRLASQPLRGPGNADAWSKIPLRRRKSGITVSDEGAGFRVQHHYMIVCFIQRRKVVIAKPKVKGKV